MGQLTLSKEQITLVTQIIKLTYTKTIYFS